ncbi:MAG: hypothetical protein FWB74_08810, partial [Defluviitaleaceae bacterium]|nr:hypothetical protein [Defluviitaleaceae bacterium]
MPKKIDILHYTAGALLPNIFLFFLYSQNVNDNLLHLHHIFVVAAALGLGGVIGLIILRLISKSMGVSFVLAILFWLFFWFFERAAGIFGIESTLGKGIMLGVFVLILLGAAVAQRLLKIDFSKANTVFAATAGVICLLFAFNLTTALMAGGTGSASATMFAEGAEPEFYVRRDFNIEPRLPSPDIYWLHLDGMTSLFTLESFWGVNKDILRDELAQRGFVIDETAYLRNSAGTHIAVPMLLSPDFYDRYLSVIMNAMDEGFGWEVREVLEPILHRDGVCLYEDVNAYLEMFAAFYAAGYDVRYVDDWWHLVDVSRMAGHHVYLSRFRQAWNNLMRTDLPHMLTTTTPISFAALENLLFRGDDAARESGSAAAAQGSPRLVWRYYDETHAMLWYRLDPEYTGNAELRLDLFPLAMDAIINSMMTSIDEILARNPYAVIVLQGDHGLHRLETHRHMERIGMPRHIALELTHSVFSAVRIPDRYGGLDTPLAPINISRELVNRFVGANYQLITPHTNPNHHNPRQEESYVHRPCFCGLIASSVNRHCRC